MAKNIQLSLNKDEILLVSNKLKVRENEIGKTLKALILGNETSRDFPLEFFQELKKVETKSVEQEVKDMTIQQLKRELGIDSKGKNENRKLRAEDFILKKTLRIIWLILWYGGTGTLEKYRRPRFILKIWLGVNLWL